MKRFATPLLVLALVGACRHSDERPEADGVGWHDLVIAELSSRAATRGWEFDERRVSLVADSSLAVPGLVYGWGVFMPLERADLIWFAAAAQTGEPGASLESADDWLRVMRGTGWMPKDSVDAVQACGEMIQTTGERRGTGPRRPIIYWDSTSLSGSPILAEHVQLSRPEVEWNEDGGAMVRVWMVEVRQTTQYECSLLPWEGASMVVIDEILNWSLPPV